MNSARRAWQGILNAFAEGIVKFIDDSGPVQMAQLTIGTLETRDSTPVVYHFGFTSRPPVGTRAMLNFFTGDRSKGVVVGTNDGETRPRGLAEGEVQIYDGAGNHIYLRTGGNIEIVGSANVTVTAPQVTIVASTKVTMTTPLLEVSGDVKAGTISLKTHRHLNSGGSGTGGLPTP